MQGHDRKSLRAIVETLPRRRPEAGRRLLAGSPNILDLRTMISRVHDCESRLQTACSTAAESLLELDPTTAQRRLIHDTVEDLRDRVGKLPPRWKADILDEIHSTYVTMLS